MMMGRGMMGNPAMLLRNEAVQKELKMTEDQVAKLDELAPAQRQERGSMQDMSQEERREAMAKMREEMEERQKKMMEILDEAQKQRLEEIRVQVLGLQAAMDEAIAAKLEITDEQKEKLEAAQEEMQEASREAMSGGAPNREAMMELREKSEAKIKEILTEAQLAKLEEMKGQPFEMPRGQGARGGRGNRGN